MISTFIVLAISACAFFYVGYCTRRIVEREQKRRVEYERKPKKEGKP